MRKYLVLIVLLFGISGLFTVLFGQGSQFHPFVSNEKQCSTCHVTFQITGTTASYIVLRADSTFDLSAACLECHPQKVATHPVRIPTPFQVPKDLPLSGKNEITCVTCHNPHFSRFSNRPWQPRSYIQKMGEFVTRKKQYKTYFLRRNNAQGELCRGCHQRVRYHWIW